jgi:hypothetical protein
MWILESPVNSSRRGPSVSSDGRLLRLHLATTPRHFDVAHRRVIGALGVGSERESMLELLGAVSIAVLTQRVGIAIGSATDVPANWNCLEASTELVLSSRQPKGFISND